MEAVLGKHSLKRRLEAYYSLISPEVIADAPVWRSKFEQIYQKYGQSYDDERKLASKLSKKYGNAVRLLVAKPQITKRDNDKISQEPSLLDGLIRNEAWYDLRSIERDSGNVSFLSTQFDPQATLTGPDKLVFQENPWASKCSRLDTVTQFALHLPADDPQRLSPTKSKKSRSMNHNKEDGSSQKDLQQTSNHPFDFIAAALPSGPLQRLQSFRKQRVRIVIRYVNSIRGELVGVLVAFDKHMNFILKDVKENYSMRRPSSCELSNAEFEAHRRLNLSVENECEEGEWFGKCRQMKHLMVRGDNVVSISLASNYRSAKDLPEAK